MLTRTLLSGTLSTSDNCKIAYHHYKNGHGNVIIIAHGFYNSKDAVTLKKLAKALSDEYDIFMFDFRGHGKSGGFYSWTSNEEKDLEAVLNYIDGKYKKVGIIAFSLGSSIVLNAIAQYKHVDSLICVSAVSDPYKVDYQFWKLDLRWDLIYTLFTLDGIKGRGFRPGPFWLKKKKPINNVSRVNIPILYIHGKNDWVVKPWHSQALYDKTKSKKEIIFIKDGPHAEYLVRDDFDGFMMKTKTWFKKTLAEPVK